MKKYIVGSVLVLNSLSAMNNNDTRAVRFEEPRILFYRLYNHDQQHKTYYAHLGVHNNLGGTVRLRSEASRIIKDALLQQNSCLSQSELIENKRTIINILRPELVGLIDAKL